MKLVDTSVAVDIDRGGVDDRVARLDDEGRHALSAVSLTELRLGVNKSFERGSDVHTAAVGKLDRLVSRFDLVPVDRPVAAAAADIIDELQRAGRPLNDLHGVYIAATARTEHLPVLTANVKHFDRIESIEVVNWTEY